MAPMVALQSMLRAVPTARLSSTRARKAVHPAAREPHVRDCLPFPLSRCSSDFARRLAAGRDGELRRLDDTRAAHRGAARERARRRRGPEEHAIAPAKTLAPRRVAGAMFERRQFMHDVATCQDARKWLRKKHIIRDNTAHGENLGRPTKAASAAGEPHHGVTRREATRNRRLSVCPTGTPRGGRLLSVEWTRRRVTSIAS